MKIALLTVLAMLWAAPGFAMEDDVPKDLHDADFITAVDVEAEVPFGELDVDEAVIAIFPRLEDRLSGMLIGRVRLKMRPAASGDGKTARPIEFRIEQAFLSASLRSEWKVAPKGRALAARRWDTLKQSERDAFLKLYNQTVADSWTASPKDAQPVSRDPEGKEFFTAFWAKLPRALGGESGDEAKRFDFRVDSTGGQVSLTDRKDSVTLFQLPSPATQTVP
jgi:hypothetical protein